jgi:hypothetical protein
MATKGLVDTLLPQITVNSSEISPDSGVIQPDRSDDAARQVSASTLIL